MDEQRNYAILFAATILYARRIQESMTSNKPNIAKQFCIDKAIEEAGFILERIDREWHIAVGND
jgi:hypothetical protein